MFKYYLLKTLRKKSTMFWSLIFPIALMTCFFFAFSNIYNEISGGVSPVSVAVVYENTEAESSDEAFCETFDEVVKVLDAGKEQTEDQTEYQTATRTDITDADTSTQKYLRVTYCNSLEEAQQRLENKEIHGIYYVHNNAIDTILASSTGPTDASILNSIANSFLNQHSIIEEAVKTQDPAKIQAVTEALTETADINYAQSNKGIFRESTNPFNWYYYSTIVMGIMFNVSMGIELVADIQADISEPAKRTGVSSEKKHKIVISGFLAKFLVVNLISIFAIAVMNLFFKIPIGNRFGPLLLFVFISNMFTLSLGEFFGLIFKGDIDSRKNKATALIMSSVFISGEMICTLPGIFERYCPIINDINPATVLNMAFYRLVYYDNLSSFYIELAKILTVSVILISLVTLRLRRQKYASL